MNQIITTHRNTDFDAMASVVAAQLIYPDAQVVLPHQINPNVQRFLSIHKDHFEFPRVHEVDLEKTEMMIVVDANEWRRLDRLDLLRNKPELTVDLWDHHPGNGDLEPDWACCEPMGANITLMLRKLKENRTLMTPMQATLFLLGLYEDTGSLSFPSTCPEDAHAAGYLLERKADLSVAGHFLSPVYNQRQKEVLFELLKTVERKKINGYRIAMGKVVVEGHISNLARVVRMYMDVANVDAAFGLFQSKGSHKCMVIGRAANEGLDIGGIMRCLGGGGHAAAGSAMLKEVNTDAVEEMIADLISGNQQASVQISDLMSFPVFSVASDTSMAEARLLMRQKDCTGLPVIDEGRLVGVLSRRDFNRLRKERQLQSPVKAFMSRSRLQTIDPGASPLQAANMMVKHDIGRLPVVEDGRIIGIVTRTDTMRYFYDLLPD
jgi:nanoRNase/pAp phosphatase (c-di-AMP/oligoRNAs hydrolase)